MARSLRGTEVEVEVEEKVVCLGDHGTRNEPERFMVGPVNIEEREERIAGAGLDDE